MIQSTIFIIGLLAAGILSPQTTLGDNAAEQKLLLKTVMQISAAAQKFSLNLHERLAIALQQEEIDRNFIISPFSVWSLLCLTAEGALEDTYKEFQDTLGLPDDMQYIPLGYKHIQNSLRLNTSTIELVVSEVMFIDTISSVQPDYKDKIKRIYEADIVPVDFENFRLAFLSINDYVKAKTNGKFERIVTLDDLSRRQIILTSATYFKAKWKHAFNRSFTRTEPFYDHTGRNLGIVNMMYQRGLFGYVAHGKLEADVLELPYGNENRFSMYVFLPHKDVSMLKLNSNIGKIGIADIMDDVDANKIKYKDEEIEVFLPRFKISSDFALNVVLNFMGLVDVFDDTTANLLRISSPHLSRIPAPSPYLSNVIHRAQIEVTEEGTVAAAVSGESFVNNTSSTKFYANRPFVYLIVEKPTKLLVLCGQVINPTGN